MTEVMKSYQLLLPTAALYICPRSLSILQQGRAGNISLNVSVTLSCETPVFDLPEGFKDIKIKLSGGDNDKKRATVVTVLKSVTVTMMITTLTTRESRWRESGLCFVLMTCWFRVTVRKSNGFVL
jgi:hypothetical protein